MQAGHRIEGLPDYTIEEIACRNGKQSSHGDRSSKPRTWATHKGGVYDITDFIDAHPGGATRIKLAAGASVDSFWKIFKVHDKDEVRTILEGMRVGNVKGWVPPPINLKADAEERRAWENEPPRNAALVARSTCPYNGETPNEALTLGGLTDADLFFVRNHMPVPIVDEERFCLRISGDGLRSQCFTVDDLKRQFPEQTVVTTIQCGGNRRTDTPHRDSVKGLAWTSGAIGTAEWKGVWLRDVLHFLEGPARLDPTSTTSLNFMATQTTSASVIKQEGDTAHILTAKEPQFHVHFDGLDKDPGSQFQVSIPLHMAIDPNRDALIAFSMNGQPIPRDHGYPLRAVIPGTVGVRNAKWLSAVTVVGKESESDWQQRDYKNFPSWCARPSDHTGGKLSSIYDVPVQSAITETSLIETSDEHTDAVRIKGYAYCGGGRGVQRVEVSVDGGNSFSREALLNDAGINQIEGKRWAWQFFEADIHGLPKVDGLPSASGKTPEEFAARRTICTRAWSSTNDIQPRIAEVNFRGLLNNGYSCVKV